MKNKFNTKHANNVEKFFEYDYDLECENVDSTLIKNWKFQIYFFNNIQSKFEVDANWTLSQITAITNGLSYQQYKVDEDQSEAFEMKYHFINTQTSECNFVLIIKKPNLMSPQVFHSLCKSELRLGVGFNTKDF